MTADLEPTLDWLRSIPGSPLSEKLVPGASADERRMLAALGGLVSSIVPPRDRQKWPPDVTAWLEAGPRADDGVRDATLEAIREDPDQALASLYALLVSGKNRRPLGTFFTPRTEADLMLQMWVENEPTPHSVVDVGAGVGVFTALAATQWPQAQVFAVDINPVTLGLLALRSWIAGMELRDTDARGPGIRTVRADYTRWIGNLPKTPGPRLILGNPPYTRAQLLSAEDRERLTRDAEGLCGSRASLSALITAISIKHLAADDGLCLLLPAQWLESQYAARLRARLSQLNRRRIELCLIDGRLFADAQVDAVVLQVGPERASESEFLVSTWTRDDPAPTRAPVDRSILADAISWRGLFASVAEESPQPTEIAAVPAVNPTPTGDTGTPLSNFCKLRRGTATGANDFFVLSEEEVALHDIHDWTVPLVRRLFKFTDEVTTNSLPALGDAEKRWLLVAQEKDRQQGRTLDRYLSQGEDAGVDQTYLCRTRPGKWFDLGHDLVVPDVIIGPMTRGRVRFVVNEAAAAIVNNLYGWTWHEGVSDEDRLAILEWLRSPDGQQAIDAAARTQGIGLKKLEPKALAKLPIPLAIARSPYLEL
ncbi:methyltransferase [Demequina zhanjiangensis]|uniref:Methyltransferase n=1 Tax=Demequina zhanjiangensis TaxID=3051659 RepID=A0ABT8G2T4_9MICO|nr:methyltransferase [Demequina sp. SYSU T00b26]MDN4473461.1 methyltransferase [Demequina sp. SYSU T00b26]